MPSLFTVAGALLSAAQVVRGASSIYANSTVPVVYTTEVVTALTTFCPAATTLTHNGKTYTITSATTLTITDCPCTISKPVQPTTPPSADCPAKCSKAYNDCRGKPDSNKSSCAAEYAQCLGYSPFGDDGSLITPTACSGQPKPTSTSVSPPADCPAKCSKAYNDCRGATDSNKATCAAEYAKCLGYNPFGNDGSLVTPTACSTGPTATGTATKSAPTGIPTVVTAGADRFAPAALVWVFGAVAMF